MKKIIFAFAVLLSMAACKQNKPTQAVENETETTALTEAVDSINQQTKLENMKEDWATSLCADTDCVVSGFQSPIERDVLHFLLKKRIPIVVVLARAMYKHIPEELTEAYDDGRLLFISVNRAPRTSNIAAHARNHYVAELANTIVFGMLPKDSSLYEIYLRHSGDASKQVKLIKANN